MHLYNCRYIHMYLRMHWQHLRVLFLGLECAESLKLLRISG